MWIALNNAFLSIVEPQPRDIPKTVTLADPLMVRARKRADLTRTFPDAKVFAWKGRDYPFRVFVSREEVAKVLTYRLKTLHYSNFKNSVREPDRHDAYMGIWTVMHRWQTGGYARAKTKVGYQRSFGGGGLSPTDRAAGWRNTPPEPLSAFPDWEGRFGSGAGPYDEEDDAGAQSHLRVAP